MKKTIFWKLMDYTPLGKSIQNKLITWRLRAAREEYKKYSLEERALIKKGRKAEIHYFGVGKKEIEKHYGIKTELVFDPEVIKRQVLNGIRPHPDYRVIVAKSNIDYKNIAYYLEIGKLGADFVVNCYPCGPDGYSRLVGYPLRKVD